MKILKNSEKYGKELLSAESFLVEFIKHYDMVMYNRVFHIKNKNLPLEFFYVHIDSLNNKICFVDEWNDFESNSFSYLTFEGQIKIVETLKTIDEDFKEYATVNS